MNIDRIKVLTVVGTRPEIIRLSATIDRLERETNHVLVHTGQNYDFELNEIFFSELGLRRPDHFLEADTSSLGALLGSILVKIEEVLAIERPHAVLILGDTNSSIAAVLAKRLRIPVYHMEAGNRSFDPNVPEETNRRLVDHVADYNLAYTEHARRNLLAEGLHPSTLLVTGSPMREVLDRNQSAIDASDVVSRLRLEPSEYFIVSVHREENVDDHKRLESLLTGLNRLRDEFAIPVLISTHPRTRNRLESQPRSQKERLVFHPPFGFHDYVKLQKSARAVLSDSGTISEESAILGFPSVSLRDAIERPEAIDTGSTVTCGVEPDAIVAAVRAAIAQHAQEGPSEMPIDYLITNTSRRVVNFIRSTALTHHARNAIRIRSSGQDAPRP